MIECLGQDAGLIFVIIYITRKTCFMYYSPDVLLKLCPKITQIALNNIKGTKNKVKRENSSFRNVK